jgi:hypothetical protein
MTINMFDTMIGEMQTVRQCVENSYHELMTLRTAMKFAHEDGEELTSDQISNAIDSVLQKLEKLAKQQQH